jgi:hypothetical protein
MGTLMSIEDILTPTELAALEAEVQKELDKEEKSKAKEQAKKGMLERARRERGLAEPIEEVLIDLPESADRVLVNNFAYMQGHSYTVKGSVGAMLRETMQRAWSHQAELEGRSKDFFRRERGTRMSARTGAVSGAPFLKA